MRPLASGLPSFFVASVAQPGIKGEALDSLNLTIPDNLDRAHEVEWCLPALS
jgi:hypothetical protein